MIALRPLPLLMMACLFFPVVPTMAQPAGTSAGDSTTSISDRVASWAAQMKAEAEALRSEGADEAVTTLGNLLKSETALLERLRAAPDVDVMLPEIGSHWADGASLLNGLAARMPAIIAAHRRRLQALQGLLVQAQGASRSLSRESETMRGDLDAARARARSAVAGSADAMKADLQAAALAATLAAREAQARLAAGFATQAGQALRRLDDASAGLDLLPRRSRPMDRSCRPRPTWPAPGSSPATRSSCWPTWPIGSRGSKVSCRDWRRVGIRWTASSDGWAICPPCPARPGADRHGTVRNDLLGRLDHSSSGKGIRPGACAGVETAACRGTCQLGRCQPALVGLRRDAPRHARRLARSCCAAKACYGSGRHAVPLTGLISFLVIISCKDTDTMRLLDDQLLLSASDLNAFLGCQHATVLARRKLGGEDLTAGEASATMRLVQRRGLEHEARFLQRLRDQGRDIVEIPDKAGLMTRVAATEHAMRAGADVIFQAALARGKWHGFADFLLRVEQPSALGGWCYEIADTKLASHAKASHAIQLGLYADLVEAIQGVPPPALRVMLGNAGELVLHPRDVVHYTRLATRRLEDFLDGETPPTEPEPCGYCAVCDWGDRCEEEWEAQDHLSLVANIRKSQQRKLRAASVETLTALAQSLPDLAVPGMAPDTLTKLRAQASLQLQTRTTGTKAHELLQPDPARGFSRLPLPDAGESISTWRATRSFQVAGWRPVRRCGGRCVRAVLGRMAMPRTSSRLSSTGSSSVSALGQARIYHYNHYEPTALKRLAMRHGTEKPSSTHSARAALRGPRCRRPGGRRLLALGHSRAAECFFREAREGDVGTAADIVVDQEFCETGDEELRSIETYNEIIAARRLSCMPGFSGERPQRRGSPRTGRRRRTIGRKRGSS